MKVLGFNDWHKRDKPKRTPPAEPKNTRVYPVEKVAAQFLFRLGGLDAVYFHPPGQPAEMMGIDLESGTVEMSARLGGHVSIVELQKKAYSAREVAAICCIIFSELRLAIQGKRTSA